jgi:hypothetical protein
MVDLVQFLRDRQVRGKASVVVVAEGAHIDSKRLANDAKQEQEHRLGGISVEMMSEIAVAWMLLDAAIIADTKLQTVEPGHPDKAFYEGKLFSAMYYARSVLPAAELKARQMNDEDKSPLEISDAAFATV